MAEFVDGRCHREKASEEGPSLFSNGDLNFQAHHVGWIITGFFTIVACVASFWLIDKHLQWYTVKREQRYIVRLLFMVPIYAVVSFASYLFWNQSTPIILLRDAYESIVLTSFFYLLLTYISPDPDEQRRVFLENGLSKQADQIARRKGKKIRKWVLPLGWIKWKPQDGMYFLQIMKWGVLQYAVLRPLTTLFAVILDYMGLYCEGSWGLGWGHVYIVVIVSLSVTVAMYCLIQLYIVVSEELSPYRPLLKLFSVKAVVFLTFWQATFLSVLAMASVVKDTKYMTAEDINIGIGAIAETFEMVLFAFLHIKAFSYRPYKPGPGSSIDPKTPPKRTPRWRSLGHAMDFRETFREIWVGTKYMWSRSRNKVPKVDRTALKTSHYSRAFEEVRPSHMGRSSQNASEKGSKVKVGREGEKQLPTLPNVDIQVDQTVEMDIGGERQWLGTGDDYGYGLKYLQREKSESLEVQIQRELARRGYTDEIPGRGHIGKPEENLVGHSHGKRSWWRSLYDRISSNGQDEEDEQKLTAHSSRRRSRNGSRSSAKRHSNSRDLGQDSRPSGQRLLSEYDQNYYDPPPQGLLRPYSQRFKSGRVVLDADTLPPPRNDGELDMLAPLSVFNDHKCSSRHPPPESVSAPVLPPKSSSGPYLAPPGRIHRSDSLLGRVFPYNTDTDNSTEQGHPNDSAQSLAADDIRPSKATPKASLIPGIPLVVPTTQSIGMGGERSIFSSTVHQDHPESLTIVVREPSNPFVPETFVTPPNSPSPQHLPPSAPPAQLPSPTSPPIVSPPFISSPISIPSRDVSPITSEGIFASPTDDVASTPSGSRSPSSRSPRRDSTDNTGLRRSSARIYARDNQPRQKRRQSMPAVPAPYDPTLPVPEYTRHRRSRQDTGSNQRQGRSSRRNSAPMPPARSSGYGTRTSRPLTVHQERSSNDAGSDITQPSYSGPLASPKFHPAPAVAPSSNAMLAEASSRYPSFVPQPSDNPNMHVSRPPQSPGYSNVHMRPVVLTTPTPLAQPHNSRHSTTHHDVSSPLFSYRPPS